MALAMKPETTYGTDVFGGSYTAGDVMSAFGIAPTITQEEIENLATFGNLGRLGPIIGIETGQVTFGMNLRGNGSTLKYASSTKPEFDLPFRGCGFSSVFSGTVGAEIVTYAPGAATPESMTIYIAQENAATIKLGGCFGTVDFVIRGGAVVEARFTFNGFVLGVSDVTYVAGAIDATRPGYPVAKSAAFQIDTANYAPRIANIGFNVNNQLQRVPSVNAVGAVAGYIIADRNPRLTIDPEADTVANYDWLTKWRAGNLADCSFQAGTVQYNKIVFTMPKVGITGQNVQTRDGLTALATTLVATIQAGGDDFTIVAN